MISRMRTYRAAFVGGLLLAGLLALPNLGQAQPTAHYAPGLEGIKAATLPPPGVYVRDYNWFYFANQINDAQGNKIGALDADAFVYVNAPRLLWITEAKPLGGYLGVDALVPLKYSDLDIQPGVIDDHTFGVGDLFFEGTWSWHLKQWDLALGAGAWAPTGNSSGKAPSVPTTMPGEGYWGEMLTAGATWYPDQEKKWALSVLNRYEFNQEKDGTDITPGQAYTVEGGLSYAISKTFDIGAVGYYQQQVTGDTGQPAALQRPHGQVAAIGPEISAFFPQWMLGVSLRYEYEFMAQSRFEGNTVTLTVTKRF
jgi:hypothetical protein